mmetsp:Transcript_8390/g.14028  ORF Transcript_8390/g.14028 Transcript_8390/m.14028 type:complete len:97 (+) Transcript_8390:477-767(+)
MFLSQLGHAGKKKGCRSQKKLTQYLSEKFSSFLLNQSMNGSIDMSHSFEDKPKLQVMSEDGGRETLKLLNQMGDTSSKINSSLRDDSSMKRTMSMN